ncbi:hypothetical protein V6N13_109791 [Hibiscus sabdariffa]
MPKKRKKDYEDLEDMEYGFSEEDEQQTLLVKIEQLEKNFQSIQNLQQSGLSRSSRRSYQHLKYNFLDRSLMTLSELYEKVKPYTKNGEANCMRVMAQGPQHSGGRHDDRGPDMEGLPHVKELVEETNNVVADNSMLRIVASHNGTCEIVNNGIQLKKGVTPEIWVRELTC